jgi:hypothetical protein
VLQAGFSKGQMAAMVVDDIVGLLKRAGRLPEAFERQAPVLGPFVGGLVMKEVVGRDQEVADVVLSVLQDKLVQVSASGVPHGKVGCPPTRWLDTGCTWKVNNCVTNLVYRHGCIAMLPEPRLATTGWVVAALGWGMWMATNCS